MLRENTDHLVERCLERIREYDAEIRAWTVVDPQPATGDGPLRGIPFGVKDIIDTAGLPTEFGSPLCAGRIPGRDAAIVASLRNSGAIMLGKTATAVFASFDPPATRNPRAPGRTPGGSSSGSAAAVAAGMAPFALGSQTLGSVLRPASYCGVCGFKPTHGLLPTEGVLAFAPSLDTLGLFAETAGDMAFLWPRIMGGAPAQAALGAVAYFDLSVEAEMSAALRDAVGRLAAAGIPVRQVEPPPGLDRLVDAALSINDYEGARSHEQRWREHGDHIGTKLAALVRRGLAMSSAEYEQAGEVVATMRGVFRSFLREYPVLLAPAATGPAPLGLESTGDPRMNAAWTALGTPAISIPLKVEGPPLGLQAIAAWDDDGALVAAAAQLERAL
jgi:Asp-tRNA(Asn)/Glu-tRNA(Gln) amidotransferase A subunit family amidase